MKVLGIKIAVFKDKDTDKSVTYCQVHVSDLDKNVVGEAVEVLKIKADLIDDVKLLSPGDEISVTYNKFGKVESIQAV